jgi:excinuclease ABC subunit C
MPFNDTTLKSQARGLPHQSGVYLFKNAASQVIYVGKAKDLKKRVAHYFKAQIDDLKVQALRRQAVSLDFFVTLNENEALFLESTLIKRFRPRYNVILRDDKQYPYLKLTLQEAWPRLLLVRKIEADGAKYFGPFQGQTARKLLRFIKRAFPIRWCKGAELKKRTQPCLHYHTRRCLAPCVEKISQSEYRELCAGIAAWLAGKLEAIIEKTKENMAEASRQQKFEQAAKYRDTLRLLQQLSERQKVVLLEKKDLDVFVCEKDRAGARRLNCGAVPGAVRALILKVREGKLIDKEIYHARQLMREDAAERLRQLLVQYYAAAAELPPEILIPFDFADRKLVEKALAKKGRVRLLLPQRGENRKLLKLAEENLAASGRVGRPAEVALQELKGILNFKRPLKRIEAFDISNLQGSNIVGAMVVFEDGEPKKAHYRKFKIKSCQGPNDVLAINEVVRRRFSGKLLQNLPLPDLLLIDGGAGQLHAATAALCEAGQKSLPAIALAKQHEEIFMPESFSPLRLPRRAASLRLLQKIRDEAHRFAVAYHRKRRSRLA